MIVDGRETRGEHFIGGAVDCVLFGTENPGSGSTANPETGRSFDDIRPLIEAIGFLSADGRANIFEENPRRLFPRLLIERAQAGKAS